jgi:hypothetical protein
LAFATGFTALAGAFSGFAGAFAFATGLTALAGTLAFATGFAAFAAGLTDLTDLATGFFLVLGMY